MKLVVGDENAGKTFGILPILIDKAARQSGLEISIVAETIPHLRRGALKDFLKIMRWTNRYVDANFNKSLLRYEFANGSVMEFFSADDSSKLRGARRDILYINECNNVTFEAYNELSIRTKREIFLDFNPANEFWVHTELKDEPDSDFIILTYKDNEALDQSIIDQIEKNKEKANSDIAKELQKNVVVYADSAEPKSIEEIRRQGITIKGVTKGKDSINYGIDVMQRQEYLVTSDSTNLIKELRSYCWDTDRTGVRLNKPAGGNDHIIDALRYHEMETLGLNNSYGTYAIR
jgi:phage terminase large subunit